MTVSYKEALERLYACRDGLESGFEATNSIDEKHRFFKIIRIVNDEIEAILRDQLAESGKAYAPLTQNVRKINKTLKELEDRIDAVVANTERAAKAIDAIEQVIKLVAKAVT